MVGPSLRSHVRPNHRLSALHLSPSFSASCVRLDSWGGPRVCHSCAIRAVDGGRRWLPAPPCGFPHSIPVASPLESQPSSRAMNESTRLTSVGRSHHGSYCRPQHSYRPSFPHRGHHHPERRSWVRSSHSALVLLCRSGFLARRRRRSWVRSSRFRGPRWLRSSRFRGPRWVQSSNSALAQVHVGRAF
jgi:hypothetical protein